jgi:redox-sensitive bicupin YhaK (pirin superfamily)
METLRGGADDCDMGRSDVVDANAHVNGVVHFARRSRLAAMDQEHTSPAIETVIQARPRDLGGFTVGRALPSAQHSLVGPFIFFDHMGPTDFAPGTGIDVRPHPHIGLATVTYLFAGEIMHRDSLGSAQAIRPGDVNWMIAGRGIVHSERTSPELRRTGQQLHGIQAWVALPEAAEESEPAFFHHPVATLPRVTRPGVELRVIAGSAYGQKSPVQVASGTLYVDAQLSAAAVLELPNEHAERAFYVATGSVSCDGREFGARSLVILRAGQPASILANGDARVMLLGGEHVGERHIEWNFVSSSKQRIELAKRAWQERRFPTVPGDAVEFIPLPQ